MIYYDVDYITKTRLYQKFNNTSILRNSFYQHVYNTTSVKERHSLKHGVYLFIKYKTIKYKTKKIPTCIERREK